jgi:hypothetical protein
MLEGAGAPTYVDLPRPPRGQRNLAGPQLHLPVAEYDSLYQYWSTLDHPDLVNGYVGFRIPELQRLYRVATRFPDAASASLFRRRGIRHVVFHPALAAGTPWADVPRRRVPPGVVRDARAGVLVFTLRG